jgi:hypothetical protein
VQGKENAIQEGNALLDGWSRMAFLEVMYGWNKEFLWTCWGKSFLGRGNKCTGTEVGACWVCPRAIKDPMWLCGMTKNREAEGTGPLRKLAFQQRDDVRSSLSFKNPCC